MSAGTIKTRQQLAELPQSPFSQGQKPGDQDYDNLLASVLFPEEDTAARIALDKATGDFLRAQFPDLPRDGLGRVLLQGVLARLLTWASERFASPQFIPLPEPAYVDDDSFTVPADVRAQLQAGTRVRVSNGGVYAYGSVATAAWVAPNTVVNLTMDEGDEITKALDGAEVSLIDIRVLPRTLITAALLADDAVVDSLGYTPANQAGDTFSGQVKAPSFVARDGAPYGKLTVTTTPPVAGSGQDGDIWMVYSP